MAHAHDITRDTAASADAPDLPGAPPSQQAQNKAASNAAALADGSMSRGRFLALVTVSAGAVVGVAAGVPVAGSVLGTLGVPQPDEHVNVGAVDSFEYDIFEKRVLSYQPKKGTFVADRVAWIRRNSDDFEDSLTGERGGFTAMWNRCAHLGCPVQNDGRLFICPCHGGVYNRDGAVKAGPPVRPLDRFSWRINKGDLVLGPPRSLYKRGDRWHYASLLAPGEYSSGFGGKFFPWTTS